MLLGFHVFMAQPPIWDLEVRRRSAISPICRHYAVSHHGKLADSRLVYYFGTLHHVNNSKQNPTRQTILNHSELASAIVIAPLPIRSLIPIQLLIGCIAVHHVNNSKREWKCQRILGSSRTCLGLSGCSAARRVFLVSV